jgi:SAM-dependent methyltransferase
MNPPDEVTLLTEQTAYALEDQAKMALAENYFAWQSRLVLPELGNRIVEVGCGIGNFTRFLLDRQAIYSVDIDPSCVGRIRARYANQPNLHVEVSEPGSRSFERLSAFLPDSCVCLNVLEHIEKDEEAIRSMASVLVPRGVIVLLIPAFPALYGPIDKNLCHYRRYTLRSVIKLAASTGLRIRKLHYLNSVGFFGWWANARLFRRSAQSTTQIKIFDRFVVPPLSRIEYHLRPPFGQSLFAVLQKP